MQTSIKKILIIKLRYIGDTLSLLPVIENLYQNLPEMIVHVMVHKGTEELLAPHPGILKLWVYDRSTATKSFLKSVSYNYHFIKNLRREKYDMVIDFSHGDRAAFLSFMTGAPRRVTYKDSSSLSRILMNEIVDIDPKQHHIVDYQLESLKILGVHHFRKGMKLVLPETLETHIRQLIPAPVPHGPKRIVIHPGAARRLRQWQPQRFGVIAKRLKNLYGAEIVLLGGPGETGLVQEVERGMGSNVFFKSNQLTLLEMAGMIKQADLLIGNDSAPGHIAAAVDCPSLILFGPTFPHMWRPYSPKNEVIFKQAPCCGCRQISCSRPDQYCMDLIEVDEVWEKTRKLLEAF